MEYVLFGVGIVLIFVSLYLTHRAENDQDSYYLESELLSEIREVKRDLEESFSSQKFDQVLDDERNNEQITKELKALHKTIGQLEAKLDDISTKLTSLEGRVTNFARQQPQDKTEAESGNAFKPEKYKEIKELMDEGWELSEIARELDMGNREVDLIWKLNQRGEE